MSRRSNQKMKVLYLAKILLEQTDRRHGITMPEILAQLSKYGIESGRKSVYDDMEALKVLGVDIRSRRGKYIRYYIQDRTFTIGELRVLNDLVLNSETLTEKKRTELSKKIFSQGESFEASVFEGGSPSVAAFGDDVFRNVDLICQAISENKRITFKCFEWNARKQRIFTDGGETFDVSPLGLELSNGRYRLHGFDHKREAVGCFYPDRMVGVGIVSKTRCGETDMRSHNEASRERIVVRFSCDNALAGDVISKFGIDITVLKNGETEFEFSVNTKIDDDLYGWIATKCGQVRIVSPEWALEGYKRMLRGNLNALEDTV